VKNSEHEKFFFEFTKHEKNKRLRTLQTLTSTPPIQSITPNTGTVKPAVEKNF